MDFRDSSRSKVIVNLGQGPYSNLSKRENGSNRGKFNAFFKLEFIWISHYFRMEAIRRDI